MAQGHPESEFPARIAAIGTTSLKTSQLALSKAVNPQIKLFAQFELVEQETMGKILRDMGAAVPSPHPADPELMPKLTKLSGHAFDKAYMEGQVNGHIKLKEAVTAYNQASSNINVKHITSLALATINEHITRGEMLLKQLV